MTKSEAAHLNCIKMFRAKSSCGPADVHFLIGLIDSLTRKLEIAEGALEYIQDPRPDQFIEEYGGDIQEAAREALKEIRG